MSNATRFDLTREEIIERYRQRIARGDRTWAIGAIVTVPVHSHCGFTAPRDWVGALNNMLAALQAIAFSVKDGVISILDGDVTVAQLREDCEAQR